MAFLLLCSVPLALSASPEDFEQDVEEEEAERTSENGTDSDHVLTEEGESEKESREESAEASAAEEESENPVLSFLYEITLLAWRAHNNAVFYASYPYAELSPSARERNFIRYDLDSVHVGEGLEVSYEGPQRKRHWFGLFTGALATADGSYGGFASLQGRFFPFLGPDVDTRFLTAPESDYLTITTAGLDASILQHDYFVWSLYGKGAFFRGVLERNGAAFGTQLRSFVAQPVSLRARAGVMVFENIAFSQFEGQLAVHVDRFELSGGAMLLQSEKARILSFEAGIGLRL
jgi:hypothetical protein